MKSLFSDLMNPEGSISPETLGRVKYLSEKIHSLFCSLKGKVIPGISSFELSEFIVERVKTDENEGLTIPFLHFNINDHAFHNSPGEARLENGDILTVDIILEENGCYSDGAWSFSCGRISPEDRILIQTAWNISRLVIDHILTGQEIYEMQNSIADRLDKTPFQVVPYAVGHGIGRVIHGEPEIGYDPITTDRRTWQDGWLFTVEPVICYKGVDIYQNQDGFYVTSDNSKTAYFEHVVYIDKGRAHCLNIPEIKMMESIDIF